MHEPRSHVLARFHRLALRAGDTEQAFAARVAALYVERTALAERVVPFHSQGTTLDQADRAQRANAQLLRRMLAGDVRLPIDVEEAIVLALSEPLQRQCLAELAARYDLLAVKRPRIGGTEADARLADLCREFGEAVESVAPLLADGRLDAADRTGAPLALKQLGDVIAAAVSLQQQITLGAFGPEARDNVAPLARKSTQ